MAICKELLDELLSGVERPEDLLGDKGLMKELDPRNNPMNLAHWDVSDIRASVLWPHRYDPGPV